MNGVHDMGGLENLGSLKPSASEPVFHEGWEARVFAMVVAAPSGSSIDAGRHQRELIPGPEYLAMSYYERWFRGLCDDLLERGLISRAELSSGKVDSAVDEFAPALPVNRIRDVLTHPGSYVRDKPQAPLFQAGQHVRARNVTPKGHTRLPRYVRGCEGVVELWHGAHVFPDHHAHGLGEDPQHLYGVRFSGRDLWGPDADPLLSVSVDVWEPHLEQV